ncbi:hypothetical protein WKQ99_10140 [Pseudomonas atacamensis]|uniref:hypothetical protein n=1 Tax=Pseudomonas atacamensis TaxID=2565368 RepID=UPI0030D13C44
MLLPLPHGYNASQSVNSDRTDVSVRHVDSGDLVYYCSLHNLPGTDIVYPVSPVMPLSPDHRKALPDLKFRMLEHLLHHHRAILMSAGNETTGGRFSFQTQLEYCMSRGYNAYQLTGTSITRFDDKALQSALAKPWTELLPLTLLSEHELPLDAAYDIPVDYVHSLDRIDARDAAGF